MFSELKRFDQKLEIGPFWISAIYLIISCLWIGFSDIVIATLISYSSTAFVWLGIIKAWGFVAATSLALFILLRRYIFVVQNTQYRLALSEERYHRFFEYTHDPVLLFNSDGRCIDANPQAEVLTGYPREELLNRHISKLLSRQSSQEIIELFEVVAKLGFIRQETAIIHQDGSSHWVEYTLVQDTGGYYPLILRDITAQKNHLESLQRAALIFQHLTVGILVTDETGRITDINPAAEKMFGYNKAEMMGQSTGVLYDLQLRKSREAIMAGLQKTGYWHGEIQFMRKNNQIGVCDRVVVPFNVSCGTCWMCRQGLQSQCETTQNHEHGTGASLFGYSKLYGEVPGGQAELLRVPFADADDCIAECEGWDPEPKYFATIEDGDTYACRMHHLTLAAVQPEGHCGHIGTDSPVCHDP